MNLNNFIVDPAIAGSPELFEGTGIEEVDKLRYFNDNLRGKSVIFKDGKKGRIQIVGYARGVVPDANMAVTPCLVKVRNKLVPVLAEDLEFISLKRRKR